MAKIHKPFSIQYKRGKHKCNYLCVCVCGLVSHYMNCLLATWSYAAFAFWIGWERIRASVIFLFLFAACVPIGEISFHFFLSKKQNRKSVEISQKWEEILPVTVVPTELNTTWTRPLYCDNCKIWCFFSLSILQSVVTRTDREGPLSSEDTDNQKLRLYPFPILSKIRKIGWSSCLGYANLPETFFYFGTFFVKTDTLSDSEYIINPKEKLLS